MRAHELSAESGVPHDIQP